MLAEKACGPKEVLAHLVFWLESYLVQVEAILAGDKPEPPQGHFDDLNAQAVEASRGVPVTKLLDRHRAACERLGYVAHTNDPEKVIFTLKKGSAFRHPLTKYLTAEAGHIRWHQKILERQVNQDYLSDIDKLRETVDRFCRFINHLPETALVEQEWGPKEVLAYLVFWHERCVAQIEAVLAKESFAGSEDRLKDLKTQAVQASRGVPVTDLINRFKAVDERLRNLGRTLDPQTIMIKVQAHQHTLDGAISSLDTHIRRHHQKVARLIKQSSYRRRLLSG